MLAFRTSCLALSRQVINNVSIVKKYSSKYFQLDDNLFGLSEDEQQLRQTIFNFVQKELAPKADKMDRDDAFPEFKEFWKKLGELGAHGITVSHQYGGTGGDYTKHAILIEEISRASASIGLSYAAQSNFVANQIQKWGSEQQKNHYLPQVCTGEKIGALAMSEPSAGSDVVGMKMTARKDGDHYVLNGTKIWITNGPIADIIIVYAKTDVSKGSRGITAFIVESDTPGFSAQNIRNKVGMRGSDTGELVFEDVRVPGDLMF